MLDFEVIKLLSDKDNYLRYHKLINKGALGEEASNIVTALGKWHTESVGSFSWTKFAAWFGLVLHSRMDASKMAVYKELFKALEDDPTFDPAANHLVLQSLIKRDFATKAAETALSIADGSTTDLDSAISAIMADYRKAADKVDGTSKYIVDTDIIGLVSKLKAPGLKWRLDCLNESIGELRKGDFGAISTRPDTGKTTMLASEATFMAEQMPAEKVVLWINNEEEGGKVYERVIVSALGITREDVESDPVKVQAAYIRKLGRLDKVVIFDKADASVADVEALLKEHDVGLIVFDQLWKLKGFDEAGTEVDRQTQLFNWGRELSKKFAPVITVHQADGSAEGQRWLNMAQLYGSKTAIQGEADFIIMIGRDPATGDTRYLHVAKNKLGGSNKAMRNGKYELQILPEIGRYKEP